MTINELMDLVYTYKEAPWMYEVRLGCECGCGGNDYTLEEWEIMGKEWDFAVIELKKLGIKFDE